MEGEIEMDVATLEAFKADPACMAIWRRCRAINRSPYWVNQWEHDFLERLCKQTFAKIPLSKKQTETLEELEGRATRKHNALYRDLLS